ncbi:MAG: histidine kinase [Ectothiorhodospiraceae bacterium]|nr:histidine kinase [Ectothiorhodospiraceae bacterium]
MQSRIRPHFLFNSLNTIASMIRSKPERAEEAVEDLAELFRAGLRGGVGDNTLGQELALARDYLRIEGLRLEERLRVKWRVDALPMDAMVPALTLQPLLENAVYHGVEPLVDGGEIIVTGERQGRRLRIAISNPLPGPEGVARQGGMGMAQDNVRQRLELAFPGSAWLHARAADERYTVTLVFPYRTATQGQALG